MNLVFEKLAQLLAAGQVWRLNIAADFVRIAEAALPVKVRILKAGRILGEMDGWQAGDYLRGVDFDAVEVENGATAQAVTVQIAGGGVGSDRVVGEVSIIDAESSKTIADIAKTAYGYVNAAASQYPVVQLWNPVGSGKRLEVTRMWAVVNNSTLGAYGCFFEASARPASAGVAYTNSKYSEGSPGVAQMLGHSTATRPTTNLVTSKTGFEPLEFKQPFVIAPGKGLTAYIDEVQKALGIRFEYIEAPA